jgi:restriction endonuclease S subunit
MSNPRAVDGRTTGCLSDLVELVRDKHLPTPLDSNVPCINLEHIPEGVGRAVSWSKASDNLSSKTKFQAGDILFGKLRPYLRKYAQPPFSGVCTSELLAFRAKPGVDPRYAYQVVGLSEFSEYCVAASFGTKMPRTDWRTASAFPVQIPDQKGQRRIADLLSAVDEQIEVCREQTSKLKVLRSGVVFERLLPLADTSPSCSLGTLCAQVTSGSRGWAGYYSDTGALFLRIGNLTREHPNLRFDDVVRVQVPEGGEGARTRLQEGDLLISITADLGIVASVPPGLGEAYVNQHIALARLSDQRVHPRWVAHALASPFGANQIARLNDGGAKAGLNLPTIRALRVPLPGRDQQLHVVELIDSIDAQIAMEQAHLVKLRLQKQGLLSKLLTPPSQL